MGKWRWLQCLLLAQLMLSLLHRGIPDCTDAVHWIGVTLVLHQKNQIFRVISGEVDQYTQNTGHIVIFSASLGLVNESIPLNFLSQGFGSFVKHLLCITKAREQLGGEGLWWCYSIFWEVICAICKAICLALMKNFTKPIMISQHIKAGFYIKIM